MNEQTNYVSPAPSTPRTIHSDSELRIELPFAPDKSSVYYIGLARHAHWAAPSHCHTHYELCYLDEGRGQYTIDHTLYDFSSGQFLLTKPGENHYGLAGREEPFKLYYIGFNVELLSALQVDLYAIGSRRIAQDTNGVVKHLFVEMITEAQQASRLKASMAEAMLQQLLIQAIREFHDRALVRQSADKPLETALLETLNRLHSEIRYDRDIPALAAAIPISRSQLARKFKQEIGVPIGEYIRNLCLSKARTDLRFTDKSITMIAEELGFDSIHAFSIFFKRFMNLSPSAYRNNSHTAVQMEVADEK